MAIEDVRVYEITTSGVTNLQNAEICSEGTSDPDLGYRMWAGKDTAGDVTKWLAKDKAARVLTMQITNFVDAGYVKNEADGVLTGGNVISIEEIPDRYWNRHASGWVYPRTLTDKVGIGTATPSADLTVAGDFKIENGTTVDELSIDGTFITPAVTDDMLSTSLAIKTYVDAQVTAFPGYWLRDETDDYLYPKEGNDKVSLADNGGFTYTHQMNIRSSTGNCLRILGTGSRDVGGKMNIGDGDYIALEELIDDELTIRARYVLCKGLEDIRMAVGTNEVHTGGTSTTINNQGEDHDFLVLGTSSIVIFECDAANHTVRLNSGTAVDEIMTDGTFISSTVTDDMLSTSLAIKTYVDDQIATLTPIWEDNGSYVRLINTGNVVSISNNSNYETDHQLTVESDSSNNILRLISSGSAGSGAILNFGDADYVHISEPSDDYLEIKATQGIYFQAGSGGSNNNLVDSSNNWGFGLISGIDSRVHIYDESVSNGRVLTIEHYGTAATIAFEDDITTRGYIGCKACSGADDSSMGICSASDIIQFGGGSAGIMMTIDDDKFRFGDGSSPNNPFEFAMDTSDVDLIDAGTLAQMLPSGHTMGSSDYLIKVDIGPNRRYIACYPSGLS